MSEGDLEQIRKKNEANLNDLEITAIRQQLEESKRIEQQAIQEMKKKFQILLKLDDPLQNQKEKSLYSNGSDKLLENKLASIQGKLRSISKSSQISSEQIKKHKSRQYLQSINRLEELKCLNKLNENQLSFIKEKINKQKHDYIEEIKRKKYQIEAIYRSKILK